MTRKEAIEAVHSMEEMPLGPFGTPVFEAGVEPLDAYRPCVHDDLLSVWIAKAEPDILGVLASLIAEPPELAPESYFEEWVENLSMLTGSWAKRDSAAFWSTVGPLLQYPKTKRRALLACIYATGKEGVFWMRPMVEDIESLSQEEQALLIESICETHCKEALLLLEGLKTRVGPRFRCEYELANSITHLRQFF